MNNRVNNNQDSEDYIVHYINDCNAL